MSNQIKKTAVVTGAAGGMGLATCIQLAEYGWQVLAIDRHAPTLEKPTNKNESIHWLIIDLTDLNLTDLVSKALSQLPPVMGLVNMAGISIGNTIQQLSDDMWEQSFSVNVTPAMRLIRLLAPQMEQQGSGSIVNVGSPVGIVGARKPSYAASKAALHGLTMGCARNLGKSNIRVNLLLPGPTITGMTEDWGENRRAQIAEGSFLKRLCLPEEVANVIAFLLSNQSSYITGSVVDMTSGGLWGHG